MGPVVPVAGVYQDAARFIGPDGPGTYLPEDPAAYVSFDETTKDLFAQGSHGWNLFNGLYKGTDTIGHGTADAARYTACTGNLVSGKDHFIKVRESLNSIRNILREDKSVTDEQRSVLEAGYRNLADACSVMEAASKGNAGAVSSAVQAIRDANQVAEAGGSDLAGIGGTIETVVGDSAADGEAVWEEILVGVNSIVEDLGSSGIVP